MLHIELEILDLAGTMRGQGGNKLDLSGVIMGSFK